MKYSIDERWLASGTDYDSFKDTLREVKNATCVFRTPSSDVCVYSILSFEEVDEGYKFTAKKDNKKVEFGIKMDKDSEATKSILKQVSTKERLIFSIPSSNGKRKPIFVSTHALDTLSQRIDVGGNWFFNPPTLESVFIRNDVVKDGLSSLSLDRNTDEEDSEFIGEKKPKKHSKEKPYVDLNLLCREQDGLYNTYAVFSEKYPYLPQDSIISIIEEMEKTALGKCVMKNWEISQFFTKALVVFPEKEKEFSLTYGRKETLTPGLLFLNSDTGDCSLRVIACFVTKSGAISYVDEISKKHIGNNIDIELLIEDIKTTLFDKYDQLPNAFSNLMLIDITEGNKSEYEKYKSVVSNVIKQTDLQKAIGKKGCKTIESRVWSIYNDTMPYTALDVCINIMNEANKATKFKDKNIELNFYKAIRKIPYCEYVVASDENRVVFKEED